VVDELIAGCSTGHSAGSQRYAYRHKRQDRSSQRAYAHRVRRPVWWRKRRKADIYSTPSELSLIVIACSLTLNDVANELIW
jgi:hypothetical protein